MPPITVRTWRGLLLAVTIMLAAVAGLRATSAAERSTATPSTVKQASPSPIAGHWEADMQGDGRRFTWLFDFTVRGDSLGGVLSIAGRDDEIRIAGSARGNKLHFEQFGLWDGTVEGAGLKLSRGLDGGKVQHMTAHRAPKK